MIVENFGWAMGYNLAALPLLPPASSILPVAAVAMGLSSVIVVLNSLRLPQTRARLAWMRSGSPQVMAGSSGVGRIGGAADHPSPVLTVRQSSSCCRHGASRSFPTLPSITTTCVFPNGGSVGDLPRPGAAPVSTSSTSSSAALPPILATVDPRVTGGISGTPPALLRQFKVAAGHYSDIVVIRPGRWLFHVSAVFGRAHVAFVISH